MSNQIHLLIKKGKEDLGIVFRRIEASYVYWYNCKYKRNCYSFQDRYKSKVVENEKIFLTVLRYIHQNLIKADIEKNISKYPWSSYNEYLGKNGICDTKGVLSTFTDNHKRVVALFFKLNSGGNKDKRLEYEELVRIDDIETTKTKDYQ